MFPIGAFGLLVVSILDTVQHTITLDRFCHSKPTEADNKEKSAGLTDGLEDPALNEVIHGTLCFITLVVLRRVSRRGSFRYVVRSSLGP